MVDIARVMHCFLKFFVVGYKCVKIDWPRSAKDIQLRDKKSRVTKFTNHAVF